MPTEPARPSSNGATLDWSVHQLRRAPHRLSALLCASAFAAFSGWLIFHAPVPALFGALVILTAAADYLAPVRFRLDGSGATAAGVLARNAILWSDVRRASWSGDEVVLSRSAHRIRGVRLRLADRGRAGDLDSVRCALRLAGVEVDGLAA